MCGAFVKATLYLSFNGYYVSDSVLDLNPSRIIEISSDGVRVFLFKLKAGCSCECNLVVSVDNVDVCATDRWCKQCQVVWQNDLVGHRRRVDFFD